MDKNIKEIGWEETIEVRHRVLWPDMPPEFCHIEDDSIGWHFGYYLESKLVSVASVYPNKKEARLRKFATLEDVQGQGIGTELLNYILSSVKKRGIVSFWCDARESSVSFYERFGMAAEGERFFKEGVPYFKMSMKLTK